MGINLAVDGSLYPDYGRPLREGVGRNNLDELADLHEVVALYARAWVEIGQRLG